MVDYGNYTNPFTPNDIPLGYSESITFSEDNMKTGGGMLEGVFFCKVKNNWNIGGGVFYVDRFRYEWFNSGLKPNYGPFVSPRGRNSYRTKQIGVSIEVNKTSKRLNIFLNLSQTVITTKKMKIREVMNVEICSQ